MVAKRSRRKTGQRCSGRAAFLSFLVFLGCALVVALWTENEFLGSFSSQTAIQNSFENALPTPRTNNTVKPQPTVAAAVATTAAATTTAAAATSAATIAAPTSTEASAQTSTTPAITGAASRSLGPPQLPAAGDSLHRTTVKLGLGCKNCCNNGYTHEPCFDVEACAATAPMGGKYGFVYAQVGRPGWPWLTFIDSLWAQAAALAEETGGESEIVVLMPAEDVKSFGCRQRILVQRYNIRIVEVPWTIPPGCWYPKTYWWPGKKDGWCGPQDLMRLHALALDDYDAVVFYDQDIEFQGDMRPVMRCAAQGYFISASGGVGEPFNVGFFALRPDRRLLRAAELFAAQVQFTEFAGWGKCGHAPSGGKFVGAECGQGFFHTLFYKNCKPVQKALKAAGLHDAAGQAQLPLKSVMVDRCIWNYQQDGDCGGNPRFNCSAIRVHHKPTHQPDNARTCGKLRFRKGGWSGSPKKPFQTPPVLPRRGSSEACQPQCVDIGPHCKCSDPPPRHIKHVNVKGEIKRCLNHTSSASGDRFSVAISGASELVVTRTDAESCWCDDIDVECCIVPTSTG